MRARPPRDGVDAHVLHPHQQQQQTEDGLDVDGKQEQRVDFKRHPGWPDALTRNTRPLCLAVHDLQTMKAASRTRSDKIMVTAVFTPRECATAQYLGVPVAEPPECKTAPGSRPRAVSSPCDAT